MIDPSDATEPGDSGADDADSRTRDDEGSTSSTDAGTPDLPPARRSLIDRLAEYDSLLEVGVGRRHGVATVLASRGADVTATDVHEQNVPEGVRFVLDDVVAAAERAQSGDHSGDHYAVEAIYALNLPPELHRPAWDVARAVGADFLFTTLGADQPTISVRRETVGEATLFVASERGEAP